MTQNSPDELDRIWLFPQRSAPEPETADFSIDVLGPFDPLDAQFGVARPKTVPDAIADAIFGTGSGANLHTYALIDAARVAMITEAMEEAGADRKCLFQGAALEKLGEVAPWVVQLRDGCAFARSLFTRSDAPWHRWADEPAIYLRTAMGLDDVVRQLRRFTRLQAADASWHFFRFWDHYHFHVLADRRAAFPALEAMWSQVFAGMQVLVPRVATASMVRLSVPPRPREGRVRLTPAVRDELKLSVMYRNMIGAAEDLFDAHPDEVARYGSAPSDLWPLLYAFADEVRAVGLSDPELRGRMMLLAFLKYPRPWPAFLELPVWQRIRQSPGQANDLFEDFCARLKYLSKSKRTELEVWW